MSSRPGFFLSCGFTRYSSNLSGINTFLMPVPLSLARVHLNIFFFKMSEKLNSLTYFIVQVKIFLSKSPWKYVSVYNFIYLLFIHSSCTYLVTGMLDCFSDSEKSNHSWHEICRMAIFDYIFPSSFSMMNVILIAS